MTLIPKTTRRRALQAISALAGSGLAAAVLPAAAQAAWPTRPIKLVLPSGPGGGADIFGRQLADYMAKELGQPVVVDNRPGANGVLAHEAVVRQPGDGYNLLISYAAAVLGNKAMNKPLSHDPIADLKPIGIISGEGGNLLVVAPDLAVNDLKGLLALAKAQGGALSYGSWGVGSGGHLVMESICLQVAEVQLGMAAPKNIAWLALRHGEALAARLTLLGDRWDAEQLLRVGIASEVVADDQVVAAGRSSWSRHSW